MGLFRKKQRTEDPPETESVEAVVGDEPAGEDAGTFGKRSGKGLFGRPGKSRAKSADDDATGPGAAGDDMSAGEPAAEDGPVPEEPVERAVPVEEADYYDWKARYRPWAGADMMGPVLAGAGVLGFLVLVLLYFVFHPIW